MKRLYIIVFVLVGVYFSSNLYAQNDTNKINITWWIHCKDVGIVEIGEDTVYEGQTYSIKEKTLPDNYKQAQSLYNALVGSSYTFEYGSLNEDINLWLVIDNIDCSQGLYAADSKGFRFFINLNINVLGNTSEHYYLNNGKHFVFSLTKNNDFKTLLQASNLSEDKLLVFAYQNPNDLGLDTLGIKTVNTPEALTAYITHFSDIVGTTASSISSVEQNSTPLPSKFDLKQNYPNPFNPSTKIEFSLPVKSNIEIKVFNILGAEVATLVNGLYEAGVHSVDFNASKLTSGMYIYQMKAGNYIKSGKMLYLK